MRAEDFSVWLCGVARLSADQRRKALAALANLDGGRRGWRRKRRRRRRRTAGRAKAPKAQSVVARTLWERAAMSGWKARGVRIARGARSSPGAAPVDFRGSAARVATHLQRADQNADGASAQKRALARPRPGDDRGQKPVQDRRALRHASDDGLSLASPVSGFACGRRAPNADRNRRGGQDLHPRILQGPMVRSVAQGAQARRVGPASGTYQDNIPVLVARDRIGATFDAVLPQADSASIGAHWLALSLRKPSGRRRRPGDRRLRPQSQNTFSCRALAGKTDPGGAPPAHQQRQRLPQPPQAMAQPFQRRRHQEPAKLSRLATRARSLGRPNHSTKLDQKRHRKWAIPTTNAIRAIGGHCPTSITLRASAATSSVALKNCLSR